MAVQVVGDIAVAARFSHLARSAPDVARREAEFTAGEIVDEWRRIIPRGPTGRTSSAEANFVASGGDPPGVVEVAAVSKHFVINFLQHGTVNMSAKVDLFGAAHPQIERWERRVAKGIS